MLKAILVIFVTLFSYNLCAQDEQIQCLLNAVEKSKGEFIRNGSKHSSTEARNHLEHKFKQATKGTFPFYKRKIISPKIFIEKIASRSSFSGKPYYIKLKKKKITTQKWLYQKLNESCQNPS